jgi:hypothetical protein
MSENPPWWPVTPEEWMGLLCSIDAPRKAVRLELLARAFAHSPEKPEPKQYLEDLLDTSSSSEIELQAFLAIRNDERQRGGA